MVDALIAVSSNFSNIRSTSMPARSHPINLQLEEKLNKLKGWEGLRSTSTCLGDLYQSVEDLLQSQRSKQVLAHHANSVEQELDGSLRLLDAIRGTRDDMLQMKELINDIQSVLRRRLVSKTELNKRISVYKSFRKKMKKEIVKRIKDLKRNEEKSIFCCIKDKANHLVVISVLRVARLITILFFESLISFTFISKPVTTRWSLISKWMGTALVTPEEATERMSETARIEVSLSSLCRHKSGKDEGIQAQNVQKQLEGLEKSIRAIEEELESTFRRLIKIRVSLLNALSY
ncbi:uncharacterized protein [Aristolochia californica]|uniref:uncharacterized protein n=1 Tax=Aristolochia californica TaxID=171875 RepID=UPI0035E1969C